MADTVFSSVSLEGVGQYSARTVASTGSLLDGQFGFLFAASGVSLVLRSGDTAYIVSGNTSSPPSTYSEAI
jgi:hypothetical protein